MDSHNHLWIEEFEGFYKTEEGKERFKIINEELIRFKAAGGKCLIDCTPCGCGRNGNILKRLSEETGIKIIPVTGFHKEKYYMEHDYWEFNSKEAESIYTNEVTEGLKECIKLKNPMNARLIKIAFTGNLEDHYLNLTNAAINTSKKVGVPILVHTEQGKNVESLIDYFKANAIEPDQVILNHIDKRNDFDLHSDLAEKGYYLEYDTFIRPKYDPEQNVWPLLVKMINAGYEDSLIIGSDIYGTEMWKTVLRDGGLVNFFNSIINKLEVSNIPVKIIDKIIGGNTIRLLNI
jgi:phosphotriesterase-related protein